MSPLTSRFLASCTLAVLVLAGFIGLNSGPTHIAAAPSAGKASAQPASSSPLLIVQNAGQWPAAARFQVWGGPGTMWLADDAIWITAVGGQGETPAVEACLESPLSPRLDFQTDCPSGMAPNPPASPTALTGVHLKLSFVGANPHSQIEPLDPVDTSVSYFLGDDPTTWRSAAPVWSGARYVNLYPGIDLAIGRSADQTSFFWRFEPAPGADLASIQLRLEGVDTAVAEAGLLQAETAAGSFHLPLPASEQPYRVEVITSHGVEALTISTNQAAGSEPGTPEGATDLLFGTYLGNTGRDWVYATARDSSNRIYATGPTTSAGFPVTPGAFDPSHNGSTDAYVTRFNAAGSALEYATFYGGSDVEWTQGIALDSTGSAYVAGQTDSQDLPTTPGAFDRTLNGGVDAFVARISPDGRRLEYASFLGGTQFDTGKTMVVNSAREVTVVGWTQSSQFPTTSGAFDRSFNGNYDAYVARFDAVGSTLLFSTYLGGPNYDSGHDLAVRAGELYVVGGAGNGFPTTPGAYDRTLNGCSSGVPWCDAFLAKLSPDASRLVFSTYLGGTFGDWANGIAVDSVGNSVVTGPASSTDFPTTSGAFDVSHNGDLDIFVTKVSAAGNVLLFSTYVGGSSYEYGNGVSLNSSNAAIVIGGTASGNFPTTSNAFDRILGGSRDALMFKLRSDGRALLYSTYLGSNLADWGLSGSNTDSLDSARLAGYTDSTNFPTTSGAFDRTYNGGEDGFIAQIAYENGPIVTPTRTPTSTPTPTRTSTPTPTNTPTPTSTPVGPWAAWRASEMPLLVPPNGVDAVVDYGNMTLPVPLNAYVAGAALFDTGTFSGTTTISTTLPAASGFYVMTLIPVAGATTGQTLTVSVDIGPAMLTRDGWISQPIYLPLLLRE